MLNISVNVRKTLPFSKFLSALDLYNTTPDDAFLRLLLYVSYSRPCRTLADREKHYGHSIHSFSSLSCTVYIIPWTRHLCSRVYYFGMDVSRCTGESPRRVSNFHDMVDENGLFLFR